MKISVIYPSRGRAAICKETLSKWVTLAKNPTEIEWILSIDEDEPQLVAYKEIVENPYINKNNSAIEAINCAAKISTGGLLVVISDDFMPFKNWDDTLIKILEGRQDFLLKTQDGLQLTLITLPIMDRTYYERFGYIYNPAYYHMFADQEMTAVGHLLGKVITTCFIFEHLHYITGKSMKDAINVKNDNTWAQGENLYNNRLKINFGIKNPLTTYSEIKWK